VNGYESGWGWGCEDRHFRATKLTEKQPQGPLNEGREPVDYSFACPKAVPAVVPWGMTQDSWQQKRMSKDLETVNDSSKDQLMICGS
jgi:hypothetical protein